MEYPDKNLKDAKSLFHEPKPWYQRKTEQEQIANNNKNCHINHASSPSS